MKINLKFSLLMIFLFISLFIFADVDKTDWNGDIPDGCTTITVGKKATYDGSVMTSHTDDSHRTRSWMNFSKRKNNSKNSKFILYKRSKDDSFAMPTYKHVKIGEIPNSKVSYGYLNSAYPCINEYQLGVGESTFGGRDELQSDKGLIDCQRLVQLMLERTKTAREAIILAGKLTKQYGWNDAGECLTISDKNEVWHLEIVGPGKDKIGSIWVAQRVPDGHVSVNANGSRIMEIDINNIDYFMASDNIYSAAEEMGYWKKGEDFKFCYVYSPKSRTSFATRRREWRVFDLVAPSLKLDPNAENYPFSVKPDKKVTIEKMISIFKDYFEGTDFNFIKNITVSDKDGKTVISPLANPFMPYDMNKIFKINSGWGWRGERTIARWYTMYGTIIQSRDWLPDEIGGLVWMALDNIATSIYIPIYCQNTSLNKYYTTPGRTKGYIRDSGWWAFNRLGTLAAQRWGDMRKDVDKVFLPMQKDIIKMQLNLEQELKNTKNKRRRIKKLTNFTNTWGKTVVEKAWELGDFLWTKYDEKF